MVGYTELVNRLLDRRMVLDKSEGPRAKYEILGRKEKNARLEIERDRERDRDRENRGRECSH